MKKILFTGGLAMLSMGLFAGLLSTNSSYVHEDYATMSDQPFQDTTPKKKDKKKKKKDTMYVSVNPTAAQMAVK